VRSTELRRSPIPTSPVAGALLSTIWTNLMADDQAKSLFAAIGIFVAAIGLLWLALEGGELGFIVAAMLAFSLFLFLKKHPL